MRLQFCLKVRLGGLNPAWKGRLYVVKPQIWPNMKLQLEYCGKDINFSNLNFKMLVAGKLEIISDPTISSNEREGRLRLLKEVVYISYSFDWKAVRKMYAAVLRRIKMAELDWNSDFNMVQTSVLSRVCYYHKKSQGPSGRTYPNAPGQDHSIMRTDLATKTLR